MSESVTDISRPFASVYKALDIRQQRRSLRAAMRKEGRHLLATAKAAISGARLGLGTKQDIRQGVYVRVYPDKYGLGFMASVKPHRKNNVKGIHVNRQGKMKPVLMFAEEGTRYRKVGRRKQSFFGKSRYTGKKIRHYTRSGHSTGRMRAYRFMEKAERTASSGIGQRLFTDFEKNVYRAAQRQGLM